MGRLRRVRKPYRLTCPPEPLARFVDALARVSEAAALQWGQVQPGGWKNERMVARYTARERAGQGAVAKFYAGEDQHPSASDARRLATADERRHTEAMRALEALIARTAPAAGTEDHP